MTLMKFPKKVKFIGMKQDALHISIYANDIIKKLKTKPLNIWHNLNKEDEEQEEQ